MKYVIGIVIFCVIIFALSGDTSSTENSYDSDEYIVPTVYVAPTTYYYPSYEDSYDTEYYHGYECTDDCSGHEAGYEWAEENGIEDPDDCGGNSNSFIEGCMSYAEENYGNYSDDYSSYDY